MSVDPLEQAALQSALVEPEYGQWEPAAEDITAIVAYVQAMIGRVSPPEARKMFDRAEGVFERYVEGFAKAAED